MKTFPTPETNLYKILNDREHRKKLHANLKRYNPLMSGLYRIGLLPLLGASRNVMLLITRGCKSGRLRTTPIGYFRIGGKIHLLSAWGKGTGWFQNLTANPQDVWIQIGLRKWPVHADVLIDPEEMQQTLAHFLTESPKDAKLMFGWTAGEDIMETSDFSEVYKRVLMVRFSEK